MPLRLAAVPSPQATTHAAPTQPVTVQPLGGQVTWQSLDPPHSTSHELAAVHSTWHEPLFWHVTSTGPEPPWIWHSAAPFAQVCPQSSLPLHTQRSPEQVSSVVMQPPPRMVALHRSIKLNRIFMSP